MRDVFVHITNWKAKGRRKNFVLESMEHKWCGSNVCWAKFRSLLEGGAKIESIRMAFGGC
jgi:hypothetical protein